MKLRSFAIRESEATATPSPTRERPQGNVPVPKPLRQRRSYSSTVSKALAKVYIVVNTNQWHIIQMFHACFLVTIELLN